MIDKLWLVINSTWWAEEGKRQYTPKKIVAHGWQKTQKLYGMGEEIVATYGRLPFSILINVYLSLNWLIDWLLTWINWDAKTGGSTVLDNLLISVAILQELNISNQTVQNKYKMINRRGCLHNTKWSSNSRKTAPFWKCWGFFFSENR